MWKKDLLIFLRPYRTIHPLVAHRHRSRRDGRSAPPFGSSPVRAITPSGGQEGGDKGRRRRGDGARGPMGVETEEGEGEGRAERRGGARRGRRGRGTGKCGMKVCGARGEVEEWKRRVQVFWKMEDRHDGSTRGELRQRAPSKDRPSIGRTRQAERRSYGHKILVNVAILPAAPLCALLYREIVGARLESTSA